MDENERKQAHARRETRAFKGAAIAAAITAVVWFFVSGISTDLLAGFVTWVFFTSCFVALLAAGAE
jgi:hypothetical protein